MGIVDTLDCLQCPVQMDIIDTRENEVKYPDIKGITRFFCMK